MRIKGKLIVCLRILVIQIPKVSKVQTILKEVEVLIIEGEGRVETKKDKRENLLNQIIIQQYLNLMEIMRKARNNYTKLALDSLKILPFRISIKSQGQFLRDFWRNS